METPPAPESRFARLAPLVEGGLLALVVLVVFALGGETVRTGLEGYRHVALGEALLRDGLMPENPWHAGTGSGAPTLYALLVILLGGLGVGPLWGMALLSVLGAALLPPALDSLGKALGLSTAARRLAFLALLLGFNGLGWLGALPDDGGGLAAAMATDGGYLPPLPLLALQPMTFPGTAFAFDGRLAAFLPALLEVGHYAIALPFLLLALAWSLRVRPDAPWRAALCVGLTLALCPFLGYHAILLVAISWLGALGGARPPLLALLRAAALALAVALPFLLAAWNAPGGGDDLREPFAYAGGSAWANLLAPSVLLLAAGIVGLRLRRRGIMDPLLLLLLPVSVAVLAGQGGAEAARLAAVLWALPASVAAAALARRPLGAAVVGLLLLLCVPTTVRAFQVYRYWDASASLPLTARDGALALVEERVAAWPPEVAAAEAELPADAVLVFHPRHPATRVGGAFASLGNALAPLLSHPLYVDLPHDGNRRARDLAERLDRVHALWEGRGWPTSAEDVPPLMTPDTALAGLRGSLPERGLAIASVTSHVASAQLFRQSGGSLLAEAQGTSLWWFPPLQAADAD